MIPSGCRDLGTLFKPFWQMAEQSATRVILAAASGERPLAECLAMSQLSDL